MELWIESSLGGLFDGAVQAFPRTSRRQHSTQTVRIEHVDWVPFVGLGTLFVKGHANNEGRKSEPIILFKKVRYGGEGGGRVPVMSSDGRKIWIERLSFAETDALVRCSCADFRWRFAHWNAADGSLYGRGPGKYEAHVRPGSSNPSESPGACKHLMRMAKILRESGVLAA